jgi:hypothetical protein
VGALHRFEQRLEQAVTGAFARAFRSAVQPMEIAAALQREVDNSAQILSRDRRLAPNDFTIDLSATDYDRLATYGQTLSSELAAMLHEHAQEQHYLFAGPLTMSFQRAEDLTTGRFRVRSTASAQVTPVPGQSMTDTAVRRSAVYLEIGGTRHPVEAPGVVIGRGSNADLRINDPGVSRRHIEFRLQPGPEGAALSMVDLGSTNGSLVNGHRVQHALLADGAVVQIGGTRIVVHVAAEPQAPPTPPSAAPQGTGQAGPMPGSVPNGPRQPSAPSQPNPPRSAQPPAEAQGPAAQPNVAPQGHPTGPPSYRPPPAEPTHDPGRQHWSG